MRSCPFTLISTDTPRMDENSNGANDDSRQGLYNEFESEIVKAGNPEAYFDEADLIEIFDYASDMDHYIVKMEVLLYGARHYPSSEALATRRAWFYSSFGEMEAAADVNNRVSNGGLLNRLLTLRAEGATDSPDTRARLDAMIDAAADLGDEDVIQLVDYCAECGMLDWIEDNRKRIEAKCSYTPTFIYEYADRAEDLGDLATARRLFEELTMMEPFTIDFWLRLSAVQITEGDFDEALASADYAIAVDSGCLEALRLKGRAMYRLGRDKNDVARIFRTVLDHPESNDSDASAYAATLIELGRTDEAVRLLEETILRHPMAQMPIDLLMNVDFKRAEPYILNVAEKAAFTRDTVIAWAKEHIANGRTDVAAMLALLFRKQFISSPDLGFLTELLYINKMYSETVSTVEESFGNIYEEIRPEPGVVFPYIMSLVRLGRSDRALELSHHYLSDIDTFMQMPQTISELRGIMLVPYSSPSATACMHIGYAALLRSIINALTAPVPMPPDEYDPLG